MSGGTVLANNSNRDLSLRAFAVEAGEIWGIRKRRKRLATCKEDERWQKENEMSFVLSYLNRDRRVGASYDSENGTRSVELETRCATSVATFIPKLRWDEIFVWSKFKGSHHLRVPKQGDGRVLKKLGKNVPFLQPFFSTAPLNVEKIPPIFCDNTAPYRTHLPHPLTAGCGRTGCV